MAKGNAALDDRETLAARVLCRADRSHAWSVTPRDVAGAPPGTHDFDLVDDDLIIAVEVSTVASTAVIRDSARWSRQFPGGVLEVKGLLSGWLLTVEAQSDSVIVRSNLGKWLGALEKVGAVPTSTRVWQEHLYTPPAQQPLWIGTLRAMEQAGILSAERIDALPPGQCCVSISHGGFAWVPSDEEHVSQFVSEQLANEHASDLAKLAAATADERTLFLWLDALSHFDIARRLDNGLLGGAVTNMGPVDEVWLARSLTDGSVKAHRWRADDGWRSFDFTATDL